LVLDALPNERGHFRHDTQRLPSMQNARQDDPGAGAARKRMSLRTAAIAVLRTHGAAGGAATPKSSLKSPMGMSKPV
jgi:hypothetical protein